MLKVTQFLHAGIMAVALLGVLGSASAAPVPKGKMVELVKTADNFIIMYDSSSSTGDRYADTDMKEIEAEKTILREKAATLP